MIVYFWVTKSFWIIDLSPVFINYYVPGSVLDNEDNGSEQETVSAPHRA